jgi:hypothetical protein
LALVVVAVALSALVVPLTGVVVADLVDIHGSSYLLLLWEHLKL